MNMNYAMEDEIKSQSGFIENLINRYFVNYCVCADIPLQIKRIKIIASGSSYNAGLYGKIFFQDISQIETNVEFASEFINNAFHSYDEETLYIFLSQSGNSADTVSAFEKVKDKHCKTLCVTNNQESVLYQKCDYSFFIDVGLEKAIAATKTFCATVFMLWMLALKAAQNKHIDIAREIKAVNSVISSMDSVLYECDNFDLAVNLLSKQKGFSIVGAQENYALCCEASLKIKEINYINTGAYPIGEFLHGHFALLNKSKTLLIFLLGEKSVFEINALNTILSRYKFKSIVVADDFNDYNCDILVKLPHCSTKIATILSSIVFVQLLSLNIAKKLKRNIDKPRGLKKVVK